MGNLRRILMLAASLAAVSSVASGYAHWVFYGSRSAPFNGVPAIFNLGILNNNTVSYFISDQLPGPLAPGDSSTNLVSQIQAAAAIWNTVPSSSIRLAFGGYAAIGQPQTAPQTTPGIDVIFDDDDVPPGLLALTRLTWLTSDVSAVANGAPFVPIRRATIALRNNLLAVPSGSSAPPSSLASYDDVFFMVAVHEFGHALGLQHTLTSGVMATNFTAATTKAAPLSPDDIAGISYLYPIQSYAQNVGSISGAVLVGGRGVNLANVVAVSASGTAISTLTNPDGTYQIQGVPAGQYYVYASPLPPAQTGESYPDNIVPPEDSLGNPFPADTGFDTEFSPGTRNLSQAAVVTVSAATGSPGVICNLQSRPSPAFSYLDTWGDYVGSNAVPAPPLLAGTRQYIVFGGPGGVTNSNALAPGLSVTTIGAATVEPKTLAYDGPGYAEIVVDPGQVQSPAWVALVVTLPNDMYVLPYAFSVVPTPAPAISAVSPGTVDAFGNTTVTLAGSNLSAATTVLFDGAPAAIQSVNSDGSLTVAAPPAAAGYTAYVEALSNVGQTSWQELGSTIPPSFTYTVPQNPSMTVLYGMLLPGATSMLDILGTNTLFQPGQVSIGLGSSDITVGQIWVLNSGRVLANVTVSPGAQPGPVDVTLTSGLETLTLPGGLQVQSANPAQMSMLTPILNQATGLAGTPAGGLAVFSSAGFPQNLTTWSVTLDYKIATTVQMESNNQVYMPIPAGIPSGPAIVQLNSPNSGVVIPAVVMQVDAPDPVVTAAVNASGSPISQSNPVHIGDTMTLTVTGLTQSLNGAGLSNTQVTIGGLAGGAVITPITVTPGSQSDSYQIQFTLGANVPFGPGEPVQVGIGTRVSAPFNLFILPHP
jgi:Matrixin/IPT/TIG domain